MTSGITSTTNDVKMNTGDVYHGESHVTTDVITAPYRATLAPRKLVIMRRTLQQDLDQNEWTDESTAGRSQYSEDFRHLSKSIIIPASSSSAATAGYSASGSVTAVKQSTGQGTKDLQQLNERLANYIDKVRCLELENRQLADELSGLKSAWKRESSEMKAMYESKLKESRRQLDKQRADTTEQQQRAASLEQQLHDVRHKSVLVTVSVLVLVPEPASQSVSCHYTAR